MSVPNGLPTYVPAGRYLCQVHADPVEKASQFGENRFYIELALKIRDQKGQWFDFPLPTTLKSPHYHQILQLCGGKLLLNGVIQAPETLVGKRFVAEIGIKMSKDGKRKVNEILEIMPYVPKQKPGTEGASAPVTEEPEEIVNDEGEIIPF